MTSESNSNNTCSNFFNIDDIYQTEKKIILQQVSEGKNKKFNEIRKFINEEIKLGKINFEHCLQESDSNFDDTIEYKVLTELLKESKFEVSFIVRQVISKYYVLKITYIG